MVAAHGNFDSAHVVCTVVIVSVDEVGVEGGGREGVLCLTLTVPVTLPFTLTVTLTLTPHPHAHTNPNPLVPHCCIRRVR